MFNKLIRTFLILSGLLSFQAYGGKYDDISTINLGERINCSLCEQCPLDELLGDCGEKFMLNFFEKQGFKAWDARHNGSGHGIDIIAIKRLPVGRNNSLFPVIFFHESKTYSSDISFRSTLSKTKTGYQESRSWINSSLNKMAQSDNHSIRQLSYHISYLIRENKAYFVRTGTMRVDNGGNTIQFVRIDDLDTEKKEITFATPKTGPLLQAWSNQYGSGYMPTGLELPDYYDAYLTKIFHEPFEAIKKQPRARRRH